MLVAQSQLNRHDNPADYRYPREAVSDNAKLTLGALEVCAAITSDENFYIISGEIRRLDFLFWLQQALADYGFQFKQEYIYNDDTHRVVALNRLKTPKRALDKYQIGELEQSDNAHFLQFLAVNIAYNAELHGGYMFLRYRDSRCAAEVCRRLSTSFNIQTIKLNAIGKAKVLLRSKTLSDSRALLHLVEDLLNDMPCTCERFYATALKASVTKELVFDAAHFITDHPGKCANLHGGRYNLHVTLNDAVDPYTGFVMDYGYLKTVVAEQVIKKLDHKSLNFSDASLSWRSSTELLSAFIWQQLIDYLPNLSELLIYETDSSYCRFRGPSLEELQNGVECMPSAFEQKQLGHSPLRRRALNITQPVHLDLAANENEE